LELMMETRMRFRDLVAKGVVRNRVTLKNWIDTLGFPPGEMTGPNTRTWKEGQVEAWLDSRNMTARKPDGCPAEKMPDHVGRPRKQQRRKRMQAAE
jgi:hypothetical protein